VQLQLKTWTFVEDYLKTKTGIIIPIGSTEQHGPTGLIGTDALTAEMIGRGAGEKAGALVAPTISVGMAQHHLGFAGSVTLRPTTLIAVVRDTVMSLARHGFTRFFFVNGHGGNIATVTAAFSEIYADRSMEKLSNQPSVKCALRNWWDGPGIRQLQKELYPSGEGSHATASEVALTMPILVGSDGQRKMSKSFGNYVGITEAPGEMFGKMMSIPDELMWSYYDLLTDRTPLEIAALKQNVAGGKLHPMDVKMRLAQEIISGFHEPDAGRKAAENFQRVFRDRQAPIEAPVKKLPKGPAKKLTALLVDLKLIASRSEAERLIKQGGVEIDGARVDDFRRDIDLSKPAEFLLRAGKKKFLRIVVE